MAENTLSGDGHTFLKPVYDAVLFLLDDIVQPRTIHDLYQKVDQTSVNLGEDWHALAEHYRGFLALVALAIVLLVILLFGGLCFCCCLCCDCCCSGRRRCD